MIINQKSGYTLIELLAVMLVLIAVGTIIASVLVSSLRNGNKSTTTNDIRQSGNYAISQMSKMIAFAKSFDSIVDINGDSHTDCVPASVEQGTPTPTPLAYSSVTITSFDQGQTTFSCLNGGLSSNSGTLQIPLFDANTIEAATCSFTCSQSDLFSSPTINIDLELRKKQQGHALLPEAQAVIDFKTSVTLRNNQQ